VERIDGWESRLSKTWPSLLWVSSESVEEQFSAAAAVVVVVVVKDDDDEDGILD
jgi:hypothetical protein